MAWCISSQFELVFPSSPNKESQLGDQGSCSPLYLLPQTWHHLFYSLSFPNGEPCKEANAGMAHRSQWWKSAPGFQSSVLGWTMPPAPLGGQPHDQWNHGGLLFYGTNVIISWDHSHSESKSTCFIFDSSLQSITGGKSGCLIENELSVLISENFLIGHCIPVFYEGWCRKHGLLENHWTLPNYVNILSFSAHSYLIKVHWFNCPQSAGLIAQVLWEEKNKKWPTRSEVRQTGEVATKDGLAVDLRRHVVRRLGSAVVLLDHFRAGVVVDGNNFYSPSTQEFPKNHTEYERKFQWQHELDSVLGSGDRQGEENPDGDSQSEEVTVQKLPGDMEISTNSTFLFHTSCPTRFLLK